MTTIDQRILIPTGPEAVWELVSNIANNPSWQVDCKTISFLSSRRDGPGVRWRYSSTDGHEYVLETTAWYDGLGYEYTFIDGASYKESKGRIRLQEIPEGTVVQWTFSYEMPGLIGGLRNSLTVKRGLENMMVESLKTLWRKAKENREEPRRVTEAKSLMRDALDYEQRAQYKSRHGSSLSDDMDMQEAEEHDRFKPTPPPAPTQVRQEPVVQQPVIIPEPPISDEDTKPRLAVSDEPPAAPAPTEVTRPPVTVPDPDFLAGMPESEPDDSTVHLTDTPDKDATKERPEELRALRVEMPVVPTLDDEPEPITLETEPPPPPVEGKPVVPEEPRTPSPPPIRIDEPDKQATDEHAVFRPPPIPVIDDEPTEVLAETVQEDPTPPFVEDEPVTEAPPPAAEISTTPAEVEEIDSAVLADEPESEPEPEIEAPQPVPEPDKRSTQQSAAVDTSKLDTSEVSIWEIFGVPRPSETQEIAAVKVEAALQSQSQSPMPEPPAADITAEPAVKAEPSIPETLYPQYTGLRIKLRRSLVHLRRR